MARDTGIFYDIGHDGPPMDDPRAGYMCEATLRHLEEAERLYREGGSPDDIEAEQDAAFGHQIMCRHACFGRTDYGVAIRMVYEKAEEMGCPIPYIVKEGEYARQNIKSRLNVGDGTDWLRNN